jgi:soluble lytic murein transglycosylase
LQADRLYEPEYNILLGTAYLGQMYKQFKGNRAHATAAYNAGPHRVNSWLKNRKDLPLDVWIEIIPFDETRTYVQNVLSFAVIYSIQQGNEQALLTGEEKKGLKLASR